MVITLKKTGQGKYTAYRNGEKVATAIFTKRYHPAPHLPVGWEYEIRVRGEITARDIAKTLVSAKRKLLTEARKA